MVKMAGIFAGAGADIFDKLERAQNRPAPQHSPQKLSPYKNYSSKTSLTAT
jgi:hypothetical protein